MSAGDDLLTGGSGNDSLSGGDGADTLSGGAGNDLLSGGSGADLLFGGSGADSFVGSVDEFDGDTIGDLAEGDRIVVRSTDLSALNGTTANGSIDLGGGKTLTLTAINRTIIAELSGGDTAIRLFPIIAPTGEIGGGEEESDPVTGPTAGNDSLLGTDGADTISALGGNDTLFGGLSGDNLFGDAGDDQVSGGAGDDSLFGGAGNDILSGGADNDRLSGGDGNDTLYGGSGNDVLSGGAGNDVLSGGNGDDTVYGGGGNDTFDGGGGTDTLVLANSASVSSLSVVGFENLTLATGGSFALSAAQHAQFTGTVTAAGSETIQVNGDGSFTTLANVETYTVGDDSTNARTVTVTSANTSVSVPSINDAVTFNLGGLTYTGTITGAGVDDTLVLATGADITGGTFSNVVNLTLTSGASVSMTMTQFSGFTGTLTAAGAETLTLSGNGDFTTVSVIESYAFGDSTADNRTITLSDAGHSVSATSTSDTVIFNGGSLTLTGSLTGEGNVNDTLQLADGANIAGATITGIENLTITGSSVTMTAAQLNGFTGTVTATGNGPGSETITLTSGGTISGVDLSGVETLATAADAGAQTVTLTAATAAGRTLTAGDAGVDHFVVTGSAGDQSVAGSGGADTLSGGAGDDTLSGGAGSDVLSGGDGADVLYDGGSGDSLSGGAGADLLYGGAGSDLLVGGLGNDTFHGSANDLNNDTISDFAVGDTLVVTDAAGMSALNGQAASGSISLDDDHFLNFANLSAASGTFSVVVDTGTSTATLTLVAPAAGGGDGGGGSDGGGSVVVTPGTPNSGGGSAQTITNTGGSPGSAAIVENTGNNGNLVTATLPPSVSITSEGPATAQSGQGAVTTLVTAIQSRGSAGEAGLVGNAQTFLNTLASTTTLDVRTIVPTQTSGVTTDDPIVITGSANGTQSEAFVIDMRSITGKVLQLDNIEFASVIGNATVTGGSGDNYATGDDNAQFISLGVGNDTLYGGGGSDTIASGSGNDILAGDEGTDTVIGGSGSDTLWGGTDADVVYGNTDGDAIYGNQENDTVFGGQQADTVFGGQGDDLVYGNLDDDVLNGNKGADALYGGQGNDILAGGADDDTLNGGQGADSLSGEAGSDLFVIGTSGGADLIADFDGSGGDRIQIAANANDSGIDGFAELLAAATNDASGNAVIDIGGGNTLTLAGVSTGQLQSGWFTFT